jgi:hypothetical protein
VSFRTHFVLGVAWLLAARGWKGSGISVARLIPLPGGAFSELTLQASDGNAENLFEAPHRGDLAYNGHHRLFKDLSETVSLDVGVSYGAGPNSTSISQDVQWTRLQGVDLTLRWKPLQTSRRS